jgi:hypothetical protein
MLWHHHVREFATLNLAFPKIKKIKGKQDFTLYPIAKERVKKSPGLTKRVNLSSHFHNEDCKVFQ